MAPKKEYIVFIDTNKFLDFYLAGDESLKYFDKLDKIKQSLVLTFQVEIEFIKNRQIKILEAMKQLTTPASPSLPGFLRDGDDAKKIMEASKHHQKLVGELISKMKRILLDPEKEDHVLARCNKLFSLSSELNLKLEHESRDTIIKRAYDRFVRGCPPRKASDTSYGDAINWEWLVECSVKTQRDVIIVTRDQDYGIRFDDRLHLNDWLRTEFETRTESKSKIHLTHLFSKALEMMSVEVSEKTKKSEEKAVRYQSLMNSISFTASPTLTSANQIISNAIQLSPEAAGIAYTPLWNNYSNLTNVVGSAHSYLSDEDIRRYVLSVDPKDILGSGDASTFRIS